MLNSNEGMVILIAGMHLFYNLNIGYTDTMNIEQSTQRTRVAYISLISVLFSISLIPVIITEFFKVNK